MATGAPMGSMGVLGRNTAAANLIIEDHIKKRVNRGTMVYKDPKKSTLVPRVNHSPFGDFPTDFLPAGAKPARASPAKPDVSSLNVTATSKLNVFIFQKSRHPSKKEQAAVPRPAVSTRSPRCLLQISPRQAPRRNASSCKVTSVATTTEATCPSSSSTRVQAAVYDGSKTSRSKTSITITTFLSFSMAFVKSKSPIGSSHYKVRSICSRMAAPRSFLSSRSSSFPSKVRARL